MKRYLLKSRRISHAAAVLLSVTVAYALPGAQTAAKKPLSVEDYPKWRSITGQEISADGKWVAYVLQLTNVPTTETKPVLHILDLATNTDVAVPHATEASFSPDSKWIAYQIDPNPARGRGGRGTGAPAPGETPPTDPPGPPATPPVAPPPTPPTPPDAPTTPATQPPAQPGGRGAATPPAPPRRVELRNLATGTVQSWENIGTFTFSPTSTHLFLKRRPAEAAGGTGGGRGGAATAPGGAPGAAGIPPVGSGPRGTDTILLDLRTGRHQLLGSVGDILFNRTGTLLAYTVDDAVKDGNGLFVFDTRSGRTVALDNDAKQYNRLAWNEDGNSVAVLKGNDVEKMREKDNLLVVFTDVPAAIGLDDIAPRPILFEPAKTESFPKGWVVSDRAALQWSEDNKRVFFGIKQQVAAPDTTRRTTDERQDVDVWNTADERIQSLQMIRAEADRNFTFRQAFDITASRFVKLSDETMRELEVAPDGKWAVGRDSRGYILDQKRPAADFYRVDTSTGERTLIVKATAARRPHPGHLAARDDVPVLARQPFPGLRPRGRRGETARQRHGGELRRHRRRSSRCQAVLRHRRLHQRRQGVIAQHKFDLWLVPLDGSAPKNLTNGAGAKSETRFRYVRTQPVT